MAYAAQLPQLLKLLQDESRIIRKALASEFLSFGSSLGELLSRLEQPPTREQQRQLGNLFSENHRQRILADWADCQSLKDDREQLEAFYEILASFLREDAEDADLGAKLDDLSGLYLDAGGTREPQDLVRFLFEDYGLRGAPEEDYYRPENSNLFHVLKTRQGTAVSLASLFILLAWRLGIPATGCNYPGHFLARVPVGERSFLVDCASSGRWIDEEALLRLNARTRSVPDEIITEPAGIGTLMCRVLRNLVASCQRYDRPEDARFLESLLGELENNTIVR